MKITADTPDLLIIDDRPWMAGLGLGVMLLVFLFVPVLMLREGNLLGLWFIPAPFLVLLFIHIFVRRTQLVLSRPDVWAEIRVRSLLGFRKIRHRLDEIGHAMIETMYDSDKRPMHRVTLVFPEGQSAGRHPVTEAYAGGDAALAAADAINRWLDSGAPRA